MKKVFLPTALLLSVLMLTGCSDKVSDGIKTDGVKEVQKNDAISYIYSEDKKNIIVELTKSSKADQVTIMQDMLSKGYSLQSVDTTYSKDDGNYNQDSVTINMYFQMKG